MSTETQRQDNKEIAIYRKFLIIVGSLYFFWWFAVELTLPNSFNPFFSRLFIVLSVFAILGASYVNRWVRAHIEFLFTLSLWLITIHYFYLFYENKGDVNWIIGCYITVVAVSMCVFSSRSLLIYSIFITLLSLVIIILSPQLKASVFFPGLVTIMLQANVGMRSRLKTLKNLRESNQRFQLLFDSTFEGVMVQKNRKILNVNKSLEIMLGFGRDELIGKDPIEFIAPQEKEFVAKKIAEDSPPYETIGIKKNGNMIELEVQGKNFEYDGQTARIVTVQEIGFKKRAEQQRITARAMSESIRLRDEFISIASHELKTPLTSLKLQGQFIDKRIKTQTLQSDTVEEIKNFVAVVNRQTDKLSRLIETMLDVSRITMGKMTVDLKKLNLSILIREVVHSFQAQSQNEGIQLSAMISEDIFIYADKYRIEQVLENLIINAVKYGNKKPIVVSLKQGGTQVTLTVKDEGIGIAPENTKRIFERFERAVPTKHFSGFGLGLYITKQIVEAHNGTIHVESKLDKGSTFIVILPYSSLQND